jgi:type IV pilus assembly protein PilB
MLYAALASTAWHSLAELGPALSHVVVLGGLLVGAIFKERLRTNGSGSRDGRVGHRESENGPGAAQALLTGRDAGPGTDRTPPPSATPRLLELLVKEGLLTPEQAHRAAAEQRKTGERSASVLKRLGLLAEDQLLDFLSRKYGIPVINLERVEVPEEVTRLVRKETVHKHQVFPVRQVGNTLTVALSDPTVVLAIDDVQFATGLHVIPVLASDTAIREAIEKHYNLDNAARIDELLKTEQQGGADAVQLVERGQTVDITELEEQAGRAPIIRFVNLILADAIGKSASDIHLEPYEDDFLVRYRIDGVLHDIMTPPKQMEAAIISRIKVMARMDIAERRLPQDGRVSVRFANKDVDLRVSSLPSLFGEKIVLRLLDKSRVVLDLQKLGFEPDDLERFKRVIQTPHGMILVTGPTGSGKSTTLYGAVSEIRSPEINIMTAEDPIEFNLPRVIQLHVREDIGLTFTAALRSFLRQDPDVILVGEIRDTETAQIAIRAALTGHLVLSTLHTNDAPSSVIRLLDMGIAPFLVSSSLLMVVAQRLVRRICLECREPAQVPFELLLELGFKPEETESLNPYRGVGCSACAHTGYRGRTAIYEILATSPDLQDAIVKRQPTRELTEIAIKDGMRRLRDAGLRKIAAGVTTFDEVLRVTFAH